VTTWRLWICATTGPLGRWGSLAQLQAPVGLEALCCVPADDSSGLGKEGGARGLPMGGSYPLVLGGSPAVRAAACGRVQLHRMEEAPWVM